MSIYACDLKNLITMTEKLRLAKRQNDSSQIKELEKLIQEFRRKCGSPYTDSELQAMTATELDETDLNFLRHAPNLIIRALQEQDLEHAQLVLNGAKAYKKKPVEGFRAMLDSAIKPAPEGKRRSIAGIMPQAGIDKCSFDCDYHQYCANFENLELCKGFELIENKKRTLRNLGFGGMLDELSGTDGKEESVQTVVRSINYGFAGMLEDAFGHENPTITPKPVVRNFGFLGMLDTISRTNEEEETFQPIVRSVECGFKAMTEDAFESKPIRRGFERELRSILDGIHSAR